jgi:hypothetical protein
MITEPRLKIKPLGETTYPVTRNLGCAQIAPILLTMQELSCCALEIDAAEV